jgi:hypothetical protein
VARTEVVGAYNGGTYDAFSMIVANDPETKWVKRWLATEDARTRPDHVEADGQVVPFDQPFTVGGFQMMYPHDPTAPAKEVVNCRCTMLLEEEGKPTNMGNRGYKGGVTAAGSRSKTNGETVNYEPFVDPDIEFDVTKWPAPKPVPKTVRAWDGKPSDAPGTVQGDTTARDGEKK